MIFNLAASNITNTNELNNIYKIDKKYNELALYTKKQKNSIDIITSNHIEQYNNKRFKRVRS